MNHELLGARASRELAASKVSDLYVLIGNEAFADASDPTLGLFAEAGEPPPSYDPHAVFAFENQVASVLDEELALLRGRSVVRPLFARKTNCIIKSSFAPEGMCERTSIGG